MRSKFDEYSLLEVYDVTNGLTKSKDDFGFGFPFLTFKEVFYNYFLPDELINLANANEKERIKCSIKRGDVFITRTSETLSELAITSVSLKDYPQATFNGFTKRLRPKNLIEINPEYAAFYFKSSVFRNQVSSFSSMTTRASLNNEMLAKLTISLPKIEVQNRIANILKTLLEKIELNTAMNQTLEAMAQTIFKSWFVDFEPFKEGKFIESELGMIPEGWEVKPLGEFSEIKNGFAFKSEDYTNEGITLIRTKNFNELGYVEANDVVYLPNDFYNLYKNYQLEKFDILVVMVAASIGKLSFVYSNCLPALQNQNMWNFKVKNSVGQLYLKFLVEKVIANNLSTAGGSARDFFRKDYFRTIKIIVPPIEILKLFSNHVLSYFDAIDNNIKEIQTLTALRDTLLPKLMSGEVRV